MMRLHRMGAKKSPFYRVVVSDSRSTPSARCVDVVGTYDPRTNPARVKLDLERARDWIRKGAHPSPTVRSLLARSTSAS